MENLEADPFTSEDLKQLRLSGIEPGGAASQIRFLRGGMKHPDLLRPGTVGDGIDSLPADTEELEEAFRKASLEGRLIHFIPASGAATRMGLGDIPKVLAPFHHYGSHAVTPLEEHIREASALAGEGAEVRLHFTISPEHEKKFRESLAVVLKALRSEGIRAEVTHSLQDAATQTLALDESGNPFREVSGNLLLRPGGHGALLPNLQACGAEFAWVHNVDNIAVESHRAKGRSLHRALAGRLVLMAGTRAKNERPLRLCGMVPNVGEPGGGPFWVADGERGESLQIVESAEVNVADAKQAQVLKSATHFNPVDLVCALKDSAGKPHALANFSNPDSCFVAHKTHEGRPLLALEWPGLWNGGMARWDTACVEIPLSLFTPVKTAGDLRRPEHMGY